MKSIFNKLFTPIITSLLDTDLYKLTMQQVVLHLFPGAIVEYRFKCRNIPLIALASLKEEIDREIDALCALSYSNAELEYLSTRRYLKPDFIDFLRIFRLQRQFIEVTALPSGDLDIIVKGPWLHTIPFEVPVLAIVNEVYFRNVGNVSAALEAGEYNLSSKIYDFKQAEFKNKLNRKTPFVFFEFGTRRRYAKAHQRLVVQRLQAEIPEYLKGTSNIALAMEFGLTPIGTMAHEYLQACQAMGVRLRDFQKLAFEKWVQEYRGDLGIALTDVVGVDAFIEDFDLYFTKLFDGVRHDSGDPVIWGEKMIDHYNKMKVDPINKTLIFSDGLDLNKAVEYYNIFGDRAKTGFGIGTNLTNDCGIEPLQIVMKMTQCNGQPVTKISDSAGKSMGLDDGYTAYLRSVFKIGQ